MLIVAFEGVDGSGKTTQAKMLVNRLRKQGYRVAYVQPVSMLLSTLTHFKVNNISAISPRKARVSPELNSNQCGWLSLIRKQFMKLLGYFYALTAYLSIRLHIGKKRVVVCDRYFYQFFFDLYGESSLRVLKIFPKPDITFFLNGDADTIYQRMTDSFDKTVSKNYYIDVINFYRILSQKYNFIQVDANMDKKIINDFAFDYLSKELQRKSYG